MFGPGFGWNFWHGLQSVFAGLGGFLLLLIFLAVTVLLVRFLLVATRAAELYVARHRPDGPRTGAATAEPVAPVAPVVPDAPVTPAAAPRTRAPKTPPVA
jgi:hypothetical protein